MVVCITVWQTVTSFPVSQHDQLPCFNLLFAPLWITAWVDNDKSIHSRIGNGKLLMCSASLLTWCCWTVGNFVLPLYTLQNAKLSRTNQAAVCSCIVLKLYYTYSKRTALYIWPPHLCAYQERRYFDNALETVWQASLIFAFLFFLPSRVSPSSSRLAGLQCVWCSASPSALWCGAAVVCKQALSSGATWGSVLVLKEIKELWAQEELEAESW